MVVVQRIILVLNSTLCKQARDDFNDTDPTSTNFAVGTTASMDNSGHTYIAYCFSEVAGYSKFGHIRWQRIMLMARLFLQVLDQLG